MRYGQELILDLHGCDVSRFTSTWIRGFMKALCARIDMKPEGLHFWEFSTPEEKAAAPPHLKGISAVQFISTSNITLHALDDLGSVFLNIFSCKDFDAEKAEKFMVTWFGAHECKAITITRGERSASPS